MKKCIGILTICTLTIALLGTLYTVYVRAEGWVNEKAEEKIEDVAQKVVQEVVNQAGIDSLKAQVRQLQHRQTIEADSNRVLMNRILEAVREPGGEEPD